MPSDHSHPSPRCVIAGAGPAGLTAAYELARLGIPAEIVEKDDVVGGLSRTVGHQGYRFDIGGHRFFTKVDAVWQVWEEVLGQDFLVRPRLSRIYYQDRFFDYPLRPLNALAGLGPVEAARIAVSFARAQLFPSREERSLEQWVSNRFGRRLFEIFFKSYTEKVWGMPCSEIGADWAAQRIKNLDLLTAVRNALIGSRLRGGPVVTSLIEQFHYPRRGPGMMWERCQEVLASRGYPTRLGWEVVRVRHRSGRVLSFVARDRQGQEHEIEATHFLSSLPIRELVQAFDPEPPSEVLAAARRLRYRDFLTVVLIVDRERMFPDNWIYIHSPKVRVARIQNFKNWSPEMVPDPGTTSLGLEYFVREGDDLWSARDPDLVALGERECRSIGLLRHERVVDGAVVRMAKAYPVYDGEYRRVLEVLRGWLGGFANLELMGRNGLHRYNNQDHSMLTAMYAARNVAGERHDVWNVNVEGKYHEEVRKAPPVERLVPERVRPESTTAELIRVAFARYDPVALGTALAAILGPGLWAATVVLLLGPEPIGPTLSLLGNYFLGYRASWGGAFLGLFEAGLVGFGLGYVLARAINAVIGWHEGALLRQVEVARMVDILDENPS